MLRLRKYLNEIISCIYILGAVVLAQFEGNKYDY